MANYISIIYLITIITIYLIIFFVYDLENIATKRMYIRDIPTDLDVEIAEYIYSSKISSKTIWSTFLNLVNKGVYKIDKITNVVGVQTFSIKYLENDIILPNYEEGFVKWLNGFLTEETNLLMLNERIKNCKNTEFIKTFTLEIKEKKIVYLNL